MSTVGKARPLLADCCRQLSEKYGVMLAPICRHVDIWSYDKLAWNLNFVGCEVLMIDAEGHDAQILRSVIRHCKKTPRAWPRLIQFETQGHCDTLEGCGTEWGVIRSLQEEGYLFVAYSKYDTHLAHRKTLRQDPRLRRWVHSWCCNHCRKYRRFPYVVGTNWEVFCRSCMTTGRASTRGRRSSTLAGYDAIWQLVPR